MCWDVNDGDYWDVVDGVCSSEQVQCDGMAKISAVTIIFPVLRKEDSAAVGKYDGSNFKPRICDTKD